MGDTDARVQELRDRIVSHLKGRPGTRERRGVIDFTCPVHGGNSAWLRDFAWGCHVCSEEIDPKMIALADLLGVDTGGAREGGWSYSLEDYADEKGFSAEKLREWGVETIPYQTRNGNDMQVVAFRCRAPDGTIVRSQVRGREKSQWWAKDGEGVYPYGLDVLAKIKDPDHPVVIVEGVSDVHALWHMKIGAVGVPGTGAWKSEWATHLTGRRNVYLWHEHDEKETAAKASAKFLEKLSTDIPRVRVLRGQDLGAKDPADLRQKLGEREAYQVIRRAMAKAAPIGVKPLVIEYDEVGGDALAGLGERLQGPIEAIPTPFPLWNSECRMFGGRIGLARGWYVLVAGSAGFGKTYTALGLACQAVHEGHEVVIHSLEMGWDELSLRVLAQLAQEPIHELEPGSGHRPDTYARAVRRANELREQTGGMIRINRRPLNQLDHILDSMRYHSEVYGSQLQIFDYLQLAWVKGRGENDRQIVEVSHETRALTKELRCVTVGLSQFNRQTSAARDERPTKEGMKGGGELEADSDQTVLLDHSRYTKTLNGWGSWLLVDKNRHGQTVDIPVEFQTRTLTMRQRHDDELTSEDVEPQTKRRKGIARTA